MADVCRKQKLVRGFALMEILAVGQISILKTRVDHHLIALVSQARKLTMGHAECPVLCIVGSSIGDKIRLIGQGMDMLLELAQRNPLSHRHAITHDMQIRAGKIDDFFALFVLDVGMANVPLARDGPIEDGGSRRNLMNL
jgi:hypothetical protein